MFREPNYYLENATDLCWGKGKLDQERLQILKKFIKGKKILDVGCGVGVYVDYLSKLGFEAVGVDFVSEFIVKALKNQQGTFLVAAADKLPFKNKSFDTVLLFNILEHGDDKKILAEAKRVAKGRIIVIVPKVVDQSLADTGVIYRHYLDKSHQREYSIQDLKFLARKVGLKIELIKKTQLLPNFAVFAALFKGPTIIYKVIGKLIFLPFLRRDYSTEILAIFDKISKVGQ